MSGIPSRFLRLFDSPVVGLISWYLLVYKELTAGQIAKLTKKNVSTITRNLGKMKEAELVHITRTKSVKNLQVKYWELNPQIMGGDVIISRDYMEKLPPDQQRLVLSQVQNIIVILRGIIKAILDYNISKIQEPEKTKDGFLQMLLLDEETGKSYEEKLKEFHKEFLEENKPEKGSIWANFDDINLDNYIIINLTARVQDVVPSID
ncbi:MAG: hypothetical protein ACFE95_04290 [Candidatus Hodarchaeota archaeon]